MRIRHRMMLAVVAPIAAIWLAGSFVSESGTDDLRAVVEQSAHSGARAAMDEIDRIVRDQVTTWVTYARSPLVQNVLGGRGSADELARDLAARLDTIEREAGHRTFRDALVADRNRSIVVGGSDPKERVAPETWARTMSSGVYVHDVAITGDDDPSYVLSLRVDGDRGRAIGLLRVVVDLHAVVALVDRRRSHSDGGPLFTLVDARHRVIRSNHPDLEAGVPLPPSFFAERPNGPAPERIDPESGHRSLVAVAASSGFGGFRGLGWTLYVEHPADAVLRPIARLRTSIRAVAACGAALGVVLALVLALPLTRRVRRVAAATKAIAHGDLSARAGLRGRDEIAQLGAMLDEMAGALQRTNEDADRLGRRLSHVGREAGKSEIAAIVLHNVGNALNSINVATAMIERRGALDAAEGVRKATGLLKEHDGDLATFLTEDERGRRLPEYLVRLSDRLGEERDELRSDVRRLRKAVAHVGQIVASQRVHARAAKLVEECDLAEVVRSAVSLVAEAFDRDRIEVRRRLDAVPNVLCDRAKVLQILVNLLTNAGDALAEREGPRRVELVLESAPIGARITVADNGSGIAPTDLPNLFQQGFTTKPSGLGVGLHFCALAAQDLGGSLEAESDGPGRGARFHLDLPRGAGPPAATPADATARAPSTPTPNLRTHETTKGTS